MTASPHAAAATPAEAAEAHEVPEHARSAAQHAIQVGLMSSALMTLFEPFMLYIRPILAWVLSRGSSGPVDPMVIDHVMWIVLGCMTFAIMFYLYLQMQQTLLRAASDTETDWWDTVLSFCPIIAFVIIMTLWAAGKIVLHAPEFWILLAIATAALWDLRMSRWVQVRITVRSAQVDELVRRGWFA